MAPIWRRYGDAALALVLAWGATVELFVWGGALGVSSLLLCCVDASHGGGEGGSMKRTRRPRLPAKMPSGSLDSDSRPR
jgi:hypothetical protein